MDMSARVETEGRASDWTEGEVEREEEEEKGERVHMTTSSKTGH